MSFAFTQSAHRKTQNDKNNTAKSSFFDPAHCGYLCQGKPQGHIPILALQALLTLQGLLALLALLALQALQLTIG